MAKRKFRSAAQGRGFKQLGSGLRAAEDRIQEQRKIETDSLRLAQLQQKEENQNYISGLTDAARFEEGVLKESHKLEDKVRTRKYEALRKLAQTDVARLEGEAREKQKEVDYWKEWTPKAAKAAQSMVTGIYEFQDVVRGQGEYNAQNDSGLLDGLIDRQVKGENIFTKNFFKDWREGKINKDNFENYLITSSLWEKNKTRTSHGATLLFDFLKKNKTSITAEVTAHAKGAGFTEIREDDIQKLHEFYAHSILKKAGIPATTRRGRKIIELYKSTGKTVYDNKVLARHFTTDQSNIAEQAKKVLALQGEGPGSLGELQEESKNLLAMIYGSHTKQGDTIKIPAENGMTWPTSMYSYGIALMDVGFQDIGGRENFQEIMSHLMSVPTKGNEKSVPMNEKHSHILEQLLKEYDKRSADEAKRGSTKQNEYNNSQYKVVTDAIGGEYWKYKLDENFGLVLDDKQQPILLPPNEQLSPKDFKFKLIRRTSDNPQLNDKGKEKIFNELGLLGETHEVAEQYIRAKDLFDSGDSDKARNYIASQTVSDQALLKPLFEEIQILDKAVTRIDGKNPRKSLVYRVKKDIFQSAEGQNFSSQRSQLHSSATYAQIAFVDAVEKETIRLSRLPEYKDNPNGAYEQAWTTINTEFEQGNREKYGDKASGRWIRNGATTADEGTSGRYLVYEGYDHDTQTKRLIALQKLGLTKDLQQVAGVKSEPFSAADTKTILEGNLFSQFDSEKESDDQYLMHPRTVSNDRITADAQIAYQLSLGDKGNPQPFQIPQSIIEYAKLRRKSPTVVYNSILRAKASMTGVSPDIGFPLASQDVCIDVLNEGSYVLDRNVSGVWAYKACQAQGVNPISFNSEDALNGLSTADAFKQRLDVELTPTSFLQNGGLFKTPVDWSTMESLNLGFYWDAASFQAAQEALKQRRKKKQFIDSRVPIPNNPELTMPIRLEGA